MLDNHFPENQKRPRIISYWLEIILLYSVIYLPGMLVQSQPQADLFDSITYYITYYATVVPQIILILFFITKYRGLSLKEFGIHTPSVQTIIEAISFSIMVFAGVYGFSYLISFLFPEGLGSPVQGFRWSFSSPALIPFMIFSSLLTGYSEELFFRSYLLTYLEKMKITKPVSILFSSLLFGVGHLYQGLLGGITTFLLGLTFAVIFFYYKRDLHLIALIHGFYNSAVLLLTLFLQEIR
ncbi:MAG: CPBP family intramembrane glutamic endopeptidase [Spirochaetia bacterium]